MTPADPRTPFRRSVRRKTTVKLLEDLRSLLDQIGDGGSMNQEDTFFIDAVFEEIERRLGVDDSFSG
jgi:hypothetical protein